jgi:hypothetical protein
MLEKTRDHTTRFLLRIIIAISFFFSGCSKVDVTTPDDVNVTIDTRNVGMIQGRVLGSKSEAYTVVWEGLSGVLVEIEGTDFETRTVTGGVYSIDSIPSGSYNVTASKGYSRTDTKPVTVIKQQVTTVEDLKLVLEPVLMGRIFQQDKATPFANKQITLYGGSMDPWEKMHSITTSTDGLYLFSREKQGSGVKEWFEVKSEGYTLYFMDTNKNTAKIPYKYDIIEKNLYAIPEN